MTELMKRLYDKAGGKVYKKATLCNGANWAGKDAIAVSPASGTLWITSIYVQPAVAGKLVNIGISAEGDEFKAILPTTVLTGTIQIEMASCPMELKNGETLYAAHEEAANTYITVRGYYT